mgnify:CR=1 FL=1
MDKEHIPQTARDYFEKHAQTGFISVPDTLANFGTKMYEAGQRAERERIATELERITNGSSCEVNSLIAELRGGK